MNDRDQAQNWTPPGEHSEHAPTAEQVVQTATRSTTSRGFSGYDEFTDLYGSRITVQQSSRAFHPAVWLRTEAAHGHEGGPDRDGAAHLTVPQALRVIAALQSFVEESKELITQGHYWPEWDNEDGQNWDENEDPEAARKGIELTRQKRGDAE